MIRVGVAQVAPTPHLEKNLDKALEYMEKAAEAGVELLCFPETHLPGYRVGMLATDAPCDEQGLAAASEQLAAKCQELSMGVIMGTETPNPDGKPFNSALVLDQNGKPLALHHKSKLTPRDAEAYSPGEEPTPFDFKGISMGLVICFEAFRFPNTTRDLAKGGAQVVFHPQFNHVLPGMQWKAPVHEALIMARAAENTIYFISANMSHARNNCRSLVVTPDGLIQKASVLGQEMLLVADLDPALATHAFLQDDPTKTMRALAEI
jgi:predicted amidohydrolase